MECTFSHLICDGKHHMFMGRFQLYTDARGQYRFRLRAANGEVILRSQGYATRAGAENGIVSVKENARLEERYERRQSESGHWFNLKATNGHVIGTSEGYASAQGRDKGIRSCMANAPDAVLEETLHA
jgi:uncharacterized protein YegP (UPF0339 family)